LVIAFVITSSVYLSYSSALIGVRRTAAILCCYQQQKSGDKEFAIEINVIQTIKFAGHNFSRLYGRRKKNFIT
jgi:hypothetical protein